MKSAPEWFVSWNENAFKPLVKKVDNLEVRMDKLETKVDEISKQVKINTNKIENIKKEIDKRFDDLFVKNPQLVR